MLSRTIAVGARKHKEVPSQVDTTESPQIAETTAGTVRDTVRIIVTRKDVGHEACHFTASPGGIVTNLSLTWLDNITPVSLEN